MKIFKLIIKFIILAILVICTLLGIFAVSGYSMYKDTILDTTIKETFDNIKSKESYVIFEELPDNFLDAVISIEDIRFYNHSGIDLKSIARAIVVNLKDGEFTEGGSTITQQVAKNLFYTQEKKLTRKVAEAFTALDIEEQYSKRDILELYVNINYYGSGYYGIYDACQGYLGKNPEDMTLAECALLAGIPNAPSVYSPDENKELSIKRQKIVLASMLENGFITQNEYDEALDEINKTNKNKKD